MASETLKTSSSGASFVGISRIALHSSVDRARIHRILWNLLSDAIKFTPSDGRIETCLSEIIEAERSYALLQVQDIGVGIAPELLTTIFEYFHQADSSISRRFGGLGLGLAIVRRLVELHEGSIQVESVSGARHHGYGQTPIAKVNHH